MKYILIILMLLTFCSEAANVKSSDKQSILTDKKPMTYKQKQAAKKNIAKHKTKCFNGYDSKTKKSIVICK